MCVTTPDVWQHQVFELQLQTVKTHLGEWIVVLLREVEIFGLFRKATSPL